MAPFWLPLGPKGRRFLADLRNLFSGSPENSARWAVMRSHLRCDHSSRECASQPTSGEMALLQYPPRFIRLKMAPVYLGMDKNLFNRAVRPCLTQIPIGDRGIAFDRLELDRWADQYCSCNGRPARKMEGQLCHEEECQDSRNASGPMVRLNGISTNVS